MKKAIVLLLALMMVGSVFAADLKPSATAPSIDLEATLSWGVDFGTGFTGFKNESSLGFTFPLIDEQTVTGAGEGVYGKIYIEDIALSIADGVVDQAGAAADISATLYLNALTIGVYSNPSIDVDMITPTHDVTAIDFSAYTFGTTIGYDLGSIALGFSVLSMGNWEAATANAGNDYAVGATFGLTLNDMISVDVAGAYDLVNSDFQGGVSVPVSLAVLKGLTITAGADFSSVGGTLEYVAGAETELQLTDANDDDEYTNVTFNAYYCNTPDVELAVAFAEPLAGGFVENLEGGASFTMTDIAASAWDLAANAGYDVVIDDNNDVMASAEFTLDSASAKTLTAEVVFTNVAIANTTLTATWTSGDLLATAMDLGTFVVACTIAY